MDQKLLESLGNLSLALEQIAEVLRDKGEAQSATAKAMKGGDFVQEIKEINIGVKQLQKDTKQILANQQTIMTMAKSKDKDSKVDDIENLGGDKKSQNKLKDGVGTILLIAVAVLAIGMAFRLVGKIDFLSVIGLSLAIVLISEAFQKVAALNLSLKQVGIASLALVAMATAITMSSWIMSLIKPIGFTQFLTATFIATAFAFIGTQLENIFIGVAVYDKLKISALKVTTALVAIATGITFSSWVFSLINPISFTQAMTAILISITFAIIGYSMHKIASAVAIFETFNIKPLDLIKSLLAIATAITVSSWVLGLIRPLSFEQSITGILIASLFLIISFKLDKIAVGVVAFKKTGVKATDLILTLVGVAAAITLSSWILSLVMPIGIWQFLTALGIVILFAVMSYFMDKLAVGIVLIEKILGKGKISLIPITLVAISLAIMLSSLILSQTADVPFMLLLKALAIGAILAIVTTLMLPAVLVLGKMGLKDLIQGSLAIVVLAGAIMLSSLILSLGNYENYPDWKWALGVGLSMLAFTPAVAALGFIAMSGVGALAILAGSAMVLVVAGTIVATSHILAKGNYANYPPLSWSASVALSMGAFALGMTTLGALIVASFGLGAVALAAGSAAVLMVADTIVETSFRLQKGKYIGGPTKEWAEGISLALGAFSPVYGMLMKNKIMSLFGGGVGPEDFANAIKTVSQGIIDAANFFADPKNKGVWKGGPTKEWAEGIGTAIGAFAPVYKVLADNSGWLASGVSVEDMAKAIMTISQGIVDAAKFFAENKSPFDEGNYPSKDWGEGVGAALGAFTPVFQALHEDTGWFTSGDDVINNMVKAISSISRALVKSAIIFRVAGPDAWKNYPDVKWADGVRDAIGSFIGLYKKLNDGDIDPSDLNLVSQYARQMANTASILGRNKRYFDMQIDPEFVSKMSKNIIDYQDLVKNISGKSTGFASMFGLDPIQRVANGMVKIASAYDRLARSVKNFSSALNQMDPLKVSSFTTLTGNIAMLSAMDSEMFSNMLKVLESRAGVFAKLIDIQDKKEMASMPQVKTTTPGGAGQTRGREDGGMKDAKGETQLQKLDKIVAILTAMNSSVTTIDQFLQTSGSKNPDIGKGDG